MPCFEVVTGKKKETFRFTFTMAHNFCAMRSAAYFKKKKADYWERYTVPIIVTTSEKLLHDIIAGEKTNYGTMFFGDKKGGIADTMLFPFVPKEMFIVKDMECVAELSPYYLNRNTRRLCRHLIVYTKKIPKPRKKKSDAEAVKA